jgi:hypothetical protein
MNVWFRPLQTEHSEVQNIRIHQFTLSNRWGHIPTEHISSSVDDEVKNVMIGSVKRSD